MSDFDNQYPRNESPAENQPNQPRYTPLPLHDSDQQPLHSGLSANSMCEPAKPSWWQALKELFSAFFKKIEAFITGETRTITDRIEESDNYTKQSKDAVIGAVQAGENRLHQTVESTANSIVQNIEEVHTKVRNVSECVQKIEDSENGIAATVIRTNGQHITDAAAKIQDQLQSLEKAVATAEHMNSGFSSTGSTIAAAEQSILGEVRNIQTAVSQMLHEETGITGTIKQELAARFQEMHKSIEILCTAADTFQKEHNAHHQELLGRFDKGDTERTEAVNRICKELSVSESRLLEQGAETAQESVKQAEEAVKQLLAQVYNQLIQYIGNTSETLGKNLSAAANANKQTILTGMQQSVKSAADEHKRAIEMIYRALEAAAGQHKQQAEDNKQELLKMLAGEHTDTKQTLTSISIAQDEQQKTINTVLEIVQNRLTAAESAVETLKAEKRTLHEALETVREQAADLDSRLQQEKNRTIGLMQQKADLERNYERLQHEKAGLEQKYSAFIPLTAGYKQILQLALQCSSIQSVVSHIPDSESTKSLLEFLLIFGSEQNFAAKVYTVMREYKKQHKEPLSEAELQLIKALNTFYREHQQLEFDIFELPESIDGTLKFDKNKMQDMDRPADTLIKGVETVYVPALRKDASVIAFKAIIKGIK